MQVQIRPIRPGDRDDIVRAARDGRFTEQTLYRRFHVPKRSFSAAELDYLTDVDQVNHIALVATPRDRPDHVLAVARVIRLGADGRSGELAVIVADRCHGRGVGTRLVAALLEQAAEVGIEEITAHVQGDNRAVQALLRKFGARPVRRDGAAVELALASIRPPFQLA